MKRDNWEWSRRKGGCFWLGGGKSARLLRVYGKDRESGGKIASTRFELQSRNEFGTALAERLLVARRNGRGFGEVFSEHVVARARPSVIRPRATTPTTHPGIAAASRRATHTSPSSLFGVETRSASPTTRCHNSTRGQVCESDRDATGTRRSTIARARHDLVEARRVITAVWLVLGPDLADLSPEHEVRLQQLVRELGRNVRRLMARRHQLPEGGPAA